MGQKEMTVNILPTRTWNRLGMNESQIQIEWPEESVLIKPERLAAGVTWEKEISGKEWEFVYFLTFCVFHLNEIFMLYLRSWAYFYLFLPFLSRI